MDKPLLQELARRYMNRKPERMGSENVLLQCPMAGDSDYHPNTDRGSLSFSVKVEPFAQSKANCFRCGLGGSLQWCFEQANTHFGGGYEEVIQFITEVEQGGFASALTYARMQSQGFWGDQDKTEAPKAEALKQWEKYAYDCHRRGLHPYMLQRGIVKHDYEKWKLGFDPGDPEQGYPPRTTFPVWDRNKRFVGVARRAVDNEVRPKFHDMPTGRWKADVFYGEDRVDTTLEHARLVEGAIGTIYSSRYLQNVLGVLGASTKIEGERLEWLRSWCKIITLIYDNDEAGHAAVHGHFDVRGQWHDGLRVLLRPYFAVRVAVLPPGCDPDTTPAPQLVRADREASSLSFAERGTSGYSLPLLPSPIKRGPKATPPGGGERQGFLSAMQNRKDV